MEEAISGATQLWHQAKGLRPKPETSKEEKREKTSEIDALS